MKSIITAILILGSAHALNAQEDFDPFAEPNIQKIPITEHEGKEYPKIKPKHVATTSGTIDWYDTRMGELMVAVSAFYEANKRVPVSREEFVNFASIRGYAIGTPKTLSKVALADGMFTYSVRYSDGRISLSHIPLTSSDKAEQNVVE